MAAINLNALSSSSSLKKASESTVYNRHVYRFFLVSQERVNAAAQAVVDFLHDNPYLCFVSPPIPPQTLESKMRSNMYLVINGDAVCLSDQPEAPNGIDPFCKDELFSGAWIREPIQCARGHTFERSYIATWIAHRGPNCPLGGHVVGSIETDEFFAEEVKSRQQAYRIQMDTYSSAIAMSKRVKEDQSHQHHRPMAISQYLGFRNESSLALTSSVAIEITQLDGREAPQVLEKLALGLSISDITEAVRNIPNQRLNAILIRFDYQPERADNLIEKLRLISNDSSRIQESSWFDNGVAMTDKYIQNVEAAISLLVACRRPTNAYEAQQLLYLLGGVVVGGAVTTATSPLVIGGITAAALYRWSYNKDNLPQEIPPCTNLTLEAIEKSKKGIAYPLIGRDSIIEKIFLCWAATVTSVRQHPLLVGPAGAGKTVIIQEVARRLALESENLSLPQHLKSGYIFGCAAPDLLPASPMFPGADKFEAFRDGLQSIKHRIVLSIDEVHTFMNDAYKPRFGELMKSVLDTSVKGMPYTLCATTTNEYDQFIAGDESIARRFFKIDVGLLDKNHTVAILQQLIQTEFPGLTPEPEILDYVFEKGSELAEQANKFKQPEVSKLILSRAIAKIKGTTTIASFTQQLNEKKEEKTRLSRSLGSDLSMTQNEKVILSLVKNLTQEIQNLESVLSKKKREWEIYQNVISKISESLRILVNLANRPHGTITDEESKIFKFFSSILFPILIEKKRFLEESLGIGVLSKATIDSAIQEIQV